MNYHDKKSQRNRKIYQDIKKGMSYVDAAKKYELTETRVKYIAQHEDIFFEHYDPIEAHEKIIHDNKKTLKVLLELVDNDRRILNCLVLAGILSMDEVVSLYNKGRLGNLRGIGQTALDKLVKAIKEYQTK